MLLLKKRMMKRIYGGNTQGLNVSLNFEVLHEEFNSFSQLLVSYLTGNLDAESLGNALLLNLSSFNTMTIQSIVIKPFN